jgi:hypothetical protein
MPPALSAAVGTVERIVETPIGEQLLCPSTLPAANDGMALAATIF